ncbi:methionyl-tRNA formyltransferase [Planctomonas psychrotolerans]|uniref:methionyl-tRNA formyltransferase n=1 Tax=Planctomonas psychrotolerans TaxID=2528712 RepID=UPI00123965D3|nr:methionyl-tRNA formyltransferase [Planctomonas psychrotolerans]
MRLIFAGTPDAAVPSLDALAASAHDIVAVITRADAPMGRKRVLTPSPVAVAADARGLEVIRANRLGEDLTGRVADLRPDLGVIVAYGGLVREPLLSTPRHGWINLHFSLLPAWRGAAPVQRALMAGDTDTGASVFQLEAGLDTGPVFATVSRSTGPGETAGDVLAALAHDGAALLTSVVNDLAAGTARSTAQLGDPTLAPKLTLDDGRLDFTRPVAEVDARLRGVTPEPGAFTTVGGQRLKVLAAAPVAGGDPLPPGRLALRDRRVLVGTATDPLALDTVQPAGKRPMPAADWWRGLPDQHGVTAE